MTNNEHARHKARMIKKKQHIDQRIAAANESRGIIIVLTGNGKGKTTAAFGNVARCIGHGYHTGIIQFIKGDWPCGERQLLEQTGRATFHVMKTGFTWETQDKTVDIAATQEVWKAGKVMLSDPNLRLVVLDEITYVLRYGYLAIEEVMSALQQRPAMQSVIITGRGCPQALIDIADTVSDIQPVKHAFDAGIQAQEGIDW
ncbi:cob(I)yrinic acid a,c-diamide adenosyltransferase [Zooshikella ganghwensis]|uniref:Corrinoid adenosyltransferase n=1 Tax=Zooshikella ganghwensis TaxID=202772 RepID=A0A4P9VRY9_9GAMM|nr:cob(I)yrinic acid a,c-diamide adenosyltransferase [Zooshikella ganghwensis]RDH44830.1 cob(I)yrinic acid a,c-diamide adenosyltransferase [Zooshikella ganghwensis]